MLCLFHAKYLASLKSSTKQNSFQEHNISQVTCLCVLYSRYRMVLSLGWQHVHGLHVSGVYLQPGVPHIRKILQDPSSIPVHEVLPQVEAETGSVTALAYGICTQDSHALATVLHSGESLCQFACELPLCLGAI